MARKDADCVFCKVVAGELPCTKVYEDDHALAFMDINPTSRGHLLVIPKGHYESLLSTPVDELKKIVSVLPKLAAAAVKAVDAEGFNVLQSNSPCAGQVVMHAHFHIVPRRTGDGIGLGFRQAPPFNDDLEETAKAIRSRL